MLPCPWVKCEGFFFGIEKKLLLQGSKGLTMVYLPYISSVWGFETMPVNPQQGFIQKHTIMDFAFFSSFSLCSLPKQEISKSWYRNAKSFFFFFSENEWITSRQ